MPMKTHLVALTLPFAVLVAWPGPAPAVLSVPLILAAFATLGLGALVTLRECWTSVVGGTTQKLLLRLRWAVWLRQSADCSALAEALAERAGLTYETTRVSERIALVGLMSALNRVSQKHSGAFGTPLTSLELARQLWAVAPAQASDRQDWLQLARAAHEEVASRQGAPRGVSGLIRLRDRMCGTVLWGRTRTQLAEQCAASLNTPMDPTLLTRTDAESLAMEDDPRDAMMCIAVKEALVENDALPTADGIASLPLPIQARLVALYLLLQDAPFCAPRAWFLSSTTASKLHELCDLVRQAESLARGEEIRPLTPFETEPSTLNKEDQLTDLPSIAMRSSDPAVAALRAELPVLRQDHITPRPLAHDANSLQAAARNAAQALRRAGLNAASNAVRAPMSVGNVAFDLNVDAPAMVAVAPSNPRVSPPAPFGATLFLRRSWQPGDDDDATSALGGIPCLPAGLSWPRHATNGYPLHFLARIDCGAAHAASATGAFVAGMPIGGSLLVFADTGADSQRSDANGTEIALIQLSDAQQADSNPAHLPADLPELDHEKGAPAPLSDRPGQRVYPRLPLSLCPVQCSDALPMASLAPRSGSLCPGDAGRQVTRARIARHLPAPMPVAMPRLFHRLDRDQRKAGAGFWRFHDAALGDGFPASPQLARAVFTAISAQANRARARVAAGADLAMAAGLDTDPDDARRMNWLEALASSSDMLRVKVLGAGMASEGGLVASERARLRAWLAAIARRNPESGPVMEQAIRRVLRSFAVEAMANPEKAAQLGQTALAFITPSLLPTLDGSDHRLGGAAASDMCVDGYVKLLQLDSDPALGFHFGGTGMMEIWIPAEGPWDARIAAAQARFVGG